MNSAELVSIIGNISQSLYPVQKLISAFAYITGIIFFVIALNKFLHAADKRAQSSSHEKIYSPLMYLVMGTLLIYLPTAILVMSNTVFGTGNILNYAPPNPKNIYTSMGFIIRTAGVLWFIRGTVLVTAASEPGTKLGPKGLVYIIAGILAMNFDNTVATVNKVLLYITQATLAVKTSQGF